MNAKKYDIKKLVAIRFNTNNCWGDDFLDGFDCEDIGCDECFKMFPELHLETIKNNDDFEFDCEIANPNCVVMEKTLSECEKCRERILKSCERNVLKDIVKNVKKKRMM